MDSVKIGINVCSHQKTLLCLNYPFQLLCHKFAPILLDPVSFKIHTFYRVGRSIDSVRFIIPKQNLRYHAIVFYWRWQVRGVCSR